MFFEDLSGVRERPMIISVSTTGRHQQRYDHRLRDLVQRTGDITIATDLGVPRSTARGWLSNTQRAVVSLDVTNRNTSELEKEILELRRRVKKLTALQAITANPEPVRLKVTGGSKRIARVEGAEP